MPVELLEVEGEAGSVQADATLLARALSGLVEKAAQYGGGCVRLLVTAEPQSVRFSVEDGGRGLEGEEEQIFEPFWRWGRRLDEASAVAGLGTLPKPRAIAVPKRQWFGFGSRGYSRGVPNTPHFRRVYGAPIDIRMRGSLGFASSRSNGETRTQACHWFFYGAALLGSS
ncbi:MAG: hypothetical protein GWP91_09480 [Rhodobacterales bacterium]|nr:hypothetical protein [Rhodobacterales bacterium]